MGVWPWVFPTPAQEWRANELAVLAKREASAVAGCEAMGEEEWDEEEAMNTPSIEELRVIWAEAVEPLAFFKVGQVGDLNRIPSVREAVCITQQRKCDYLTNLHDIVARRCPRNKVGAPIVSDYDKINATFDEHLEALACVVDPKLRRKVV